MSSLKKPNQKQKWLAAFLLTDVSPAVCVRRINMKCAYQQTWKLSNEDISNTFSATMCRPRCVIARIQELIKHERTTMRHELGQLVLGSQRLALLEEHNIIMEPTAEIMSCVSWEKAFHNSLLRASSKENINLLIWAYIYIRVVNHKQPSVHTFKRFYVWTKKNKKGKKKIEEKESIIFLFTIKTPNLEIPKQRKKYKLFDDCQLLSCHFSYYPLSLFFVTTMDNFRSNRCPPIVASTATSSSSSNAAQAARRQSRAPEFIHSPIAIVPDYIDGMNAYVKMPEQIIF